MAYAPLPQSADKNTLFSRLNLDERVYKLLLKEAELARDALSCNPDNVTDQSRADPAVVQPYRWDEISETAKHLQILQVVRTASIETQHYYALGRYMTSVNEENWVARWFLWHSFRYRDNRPRDRVRSNNATQGDEVSQAHPNTGAYYDPARNYYR